MILLMNDSMNESSVYQAACLVAQIVGMGALVGLCVFLLSYALVVLVVTWMEAGKQIVVL